MNYCNFAKVFQARTSKDRNVLEWKENGMVTDYPTAPKYVTNFSDQQRFENYISLISKFPKLHVPFSTFRLNLRSARLRYEQKNISEMATTTEKEKHLHSTFLSRLGINYLKMRKSLINLLIVTPVPLYMQSFLPSIPQPVHSRNI